MGRLDRGGGCCGRHGSQPAGLQALQGRRGTEQGESERECWGRGWGGQRVAGRPFWLVRKEVVLNGELRMVSRWPKTMEAGGASVFCFREMRCSFS